MTKVNLDNMHSPCLMCFQRFNHSFDENSTLCQRCEYNVAIQLLKGILRSNNHCAICKSRVNLGGGYWECKKKLEEECSDKDFEIDWKEAFKEYNIEIETKS